MTKKLQISLLALLGLILYSSMIIGQTVNMSRYIELTATQGEWIKMEFSGDSINTDIMVVSGTKDTLLTIDTNWTGFKHYYSQTTTMRVYGNVKEFKVWENTDKLTGLDASNNKGLVFLDCYDNNITNINVSGLKNLWDFSCAYNSLTSLDISGLDSLSHLHCGGNQLTSLDIRGLSKLIGIACFDNQLSACGLDSIFHQLPSRFINNDATIYIQSDEETNPGVETCRDTIATNRNWKVVNYHNWGQILQPIVNITYSCPYFTLDIEEVKQDNISAKVYPNPAKDAINIETKEKIKDITLYDVAGKEILRTKEIKNIDVSYLENGIYILKLCTQKGTGEYKVIKQ